MARNRQFVRGAAAISKARKTTWFDIPPQSTALGGNVVFLAASMVAEELAKRPFTIVRTHLELMIVSDQLAASETQIVGVGIAVVSEQAEAIGVTAVPTPISDLNSDLWLLHKLLFNQLSFGSAVGFESQAGRLVSIDSKAMRKVNNDQEIVVMIETQGAGAAVTIGGRLLIKEH